MSSSSFVVLFNSDLAHIVTSFQRGTHIDLKSFRTKLCPIYAGFCEPHLIRPRMLQTHAILGPWFDQHGLTRLDKLLAVSPKMQQVVVQYAVYYGRLDIAQHMHIKFDLISFKENLLDFAALNDQVEMLVYLQNIGHNGQTKRSLIWAAQYGHLATVQFLVRMDPTRYPWTDVIQIASKHGHHTIARFLERSKGRVVALKRPPSARTWYGAPASRAQK
ncbi:Aste57867_16164 [Aphanomyces stellatus]|uniref:Aste57867_16164 protein n=1 Tax=Aphanomyces stellatus TaxID=120398 RepID=A0A485L4Z1_9STRA|nr:hypothetical protein As57867_016108 [Aphanomyces stellatus]VFT92943.1 Aste57867_16164 [Aphanomyces stellatus]